MPVTLRELRDDLRVRLGELSPDQFPNEMLNQWVNWGQMAVANKLAPIAHIWLGKMAPLAPSLGHALTTDFEHFEDTASPAEDVYYTHSTGVITLGSAFSIAGAADAFKGGLAIFGSNAGKVYVDTIKTHGTGAGATITVEKRGGQSADISTADGNFVYLIKSSNANNNLLLPPDAVRPVKLSDGDDLFPILSDADDLEGVGSNTYFSTTTYGVHHGDSIRTVRGSGATFPKAAILWYIRRPTPLINDADELNVESGRVPEEFSDLVIMAAHVKALTGRRPTQGVQAEMDRLYASVERAFSTALGQAQAQKEE